MWFYASLLSKFIGRIPLESVAGMKWNHWPESRGIHGRNALEYAVYLKMEVRQKREVQKKFVQYTQSLLTDDNQIVELTTWETDREILAWLDSL